MATIAWQWPATKLLHFNCRKIQDSNFYRLTIPCRLWKTDVGLQQLKIR